MVEVTGKEFDEKIKQALHVERCRACGGAKGIITHIEPIYGRLGVKVFCPLCGHQTKLVRHTDCFTDDSRLGTPVTAESLAKAIFEAVEEWNGKQADRQE